MKYLLSLMLLVGCSKPADKVCKQPEQKLVATVNGCRVYDVIAEVPYKDDITGGVRCHGRWFMYTDCHDSTVQFSCGKSCNIANHTR